MTIKVQILTPVRKTMSHHEFFKPSNRHPPPLEKFWLQACCKQLYTSKNVIWNNTYFTYIIFICVIFKKCQYSR